MRKSIKVTQALHKDTRKTMVMVGKALFDLTPSRLTIDDIIKMEPKDLPHVRTLNAIPDRTAEEQILHNQGEAKFHILCQKIPRPKNAGKVTSLKKAASLGADVPAEIAKLLQQKEEAKKKKDSKTMRMIRVQLRKLDYKRFTSKEE